MSHHAFHPPILTPSKKQFPISYNALGQIATRADLSRGVNTHYDAYDAFGRLTDMHTDGSSDVEHLAQSFDFDHRGNLTEVTTDYTSASYADSRVERLYTAYSQIEEETVFVGGSEHSALKQRWDSAGRREALLDGSQEVFTYKQNAAGLITQVTEHISGTSSRFDYAYTRSGLLRSRERSGGAATFVRGRDGLGRVTDRYVRDGSGDVFAREDALAWRADSKLLSHEVAYGESTSQRVRRAFVYNTRGQLSRESYAWGTGVFDTHVYDYDADKLGVLTGVNRYNDLGQATPWNARGFSLDSWARVQSQSLGGGVSVPLEGYAVDAGFVRLSLAAEPEAVPLFEAPVDASGNFAVSAELPNGSYTLEASAVHASGAYETGKQSRAFTVSSGATAGGSSTFDESGFLDTRSGPNGRVESFVWDALGRLLRHTDTHGASADYVYDGLGRRLEERVSGRSAVKSLYDPQVEFLEIAVVRDGETVWKLYGPDLSGTFGGLQGVGGLDAFVTATETVTVLSNVQGHVLAHERGGALTATSSTYSAYGPRSGVAVLSDTGSLLDELVNAHAWRGYRVDASGLISMGARYYDYESGRFISPDPLGHEECMDLYSYANGDPVNFLDPTGRGATSGDPANTVNPSGPIVWSGPVNYRFGSLVLSYGRFDGVLKSNENPPRTALISGNLYGVGVQAGYVTGQIEKAVWIGSKPDEIIGPNGVFFNGGIGIGAGPINIIGYDGEIATHSDQYSADISSIQGQFVGPGISTTFDPANPASYFEKPKVGFGAGVGVNGLDVIHFEILEENR